MRVLWIATSVALASASCEMTADANKYLYMGEPTPDKARNGLDRHMEFSHCAMKNVGDECKITKCMGNMIASGTTTLECKSDKVYPKAGGTLTCVQEKSKSLGIVPNAKTIDPFNLYFRFYYGSAACDPKTMVKDVTTKMWPHSSGAKLSTLQFGQGVVSTIRAFPYPHPKLDKAAWFKGGALDFTKVAPVTGKSEYFRGEYIATLTMQKFWDACKLMDKADKANDGYYTADKGVCVPIASNVSFQFQAEWAFKGGKTVCPKTDIAWGAWWLEAPVAGKMSVGSLLFLVGPAVSACLLLTCLVGMCICCCVMCRNKA